MVACSTIQPGSQLVHLSIQPILELFKMLILLYAAFNHALVLVFDHIQTGLIVFRDFSLAFLHNVKAVVPLQGRDYGIDLALPKTLRDILTQLILVQFEAINPLREILGTFTSLSLMLITLLLNELHHISQVSDLLL